jgi:hypothetical protein
MSDISFDHIIQTNYNIHYQGGGFPRPQGVEPMSLSELLQDLHALEIRLREYETRYGIASEDFYELYKQGLLDNDGLERTSEFTRWASAFTMKLEREQSFRQISQRFVSALRHQAPRGMIQLTPNPELQRI